MEASRRAEALATEFAMTKNSVAEENTARRRLFIFHGNPFCVSSLVGCIAALSSIISGCRLEDRFIFHPNHEISRTPGDIGIPFDDVLFTTSDGVRLHGWFIPHLDARTTFLWFHGNAGNISDRLLNIKLLHEKIDSNIFIFDYRGFGRSEGRASELGTYLDGEAAIRYLLERRKNEANNIVLFGRSLGAAVAAEMATRFDCRGLILESPFVSVAEMARAIFPSVPIATLLHTRYDVVDKLRRVNIPLLVLHGDADEVVPFEQGKRVFDAAVSENKRFHAIVGANHNDTFIVGGETYFATLRKFINALGTD
jgi:uncharacterized protein